MTAADQTPATRHFAPWGSHTASCGAALASDEAPESPRFTARRDNTTCPDCRAHFTNPADQIPGERCGECRLGLGTHTPTDPHCAHHQTPATDSERDERVEDIRARVETTEPSPGMHAGEWERRYARDVRYLLVLLAEQAATIESITALVRDLTDPDDCWFDHHGGCQAHGYLSLKPGETCPHTDAKALALGSQRTEGQG